VGAAVGERRRACQAGSRRGGAPGEEERFIGRASEEGGRRLEGGQLHSPLLCWWPRLRGGPEAPCGISHPPWRLSRSPFLGVVPQPSPRAGPTAPVQRASPSVAYNLRQCANLLAQWGRTPRSFEPGPCHSCGASNAASRARATDVSSKAVNLQASYARRHTQLQPKGSRGLSSAVPTWPRTRSGRLIPFEPATLAGPMPLAEHLMPPAGHGPQMRQRGRVRMSRHLRAWGGLAGPARTRRCRGGVWSRLAHRARVWGVRPHCAPSGRSTARPTPEPLPPGSCLLSRCCPPLSDRHAEG
jgi:hypothetical protein